MILVEPCRCNETSMCFSNNVLACYTLHIYDDRDGTSVYCYYCEDCKQKKLKLERYQKLVFEPLWY